MRILRSLRDISIITFHDIMSTQDTTLLIDGECEDKSIYKDECDAIWLVLFDEYFKLKGDGRASNMISKNIDSTYTRSKLSACEAALIALSNLQYFDDQKYIAEKKIGIISVLKDISKEFNKLKELDDLKETINRIIDIHKAIKRKYDLNNSNVKKVESEEIVKINLIEDNLVDIQNVLGYSIGDFKTISVTAYIALEKSAKNKIKQIKAQKRNGRK